MKTKVWKSGFCSNNFDFSSHARCKTVYQNGTKGEVRCGCDQPWCTCFVAADAQDKQAKVSTWDAMFDD